MVMPQVTAARVYQLYPRSALRVRSHRSLRSSSAGYCEALTYFHPSTVLQLVQYMSATVCMPVMSGRSSLGPSVTFTLWQDLHSGLREEKQD